MKNVKKALLMFLCIVAIVGATVMGTLAWLTDEDYVENTMTVGDVSITVDEADVNADGTLAASGARVKTNIYHLIPGGEYIKDPTMTVLSNSEPAYVRMLLTMDCKSALDLAFAPGVYLDQIFGGYDDTAWFYIGETVDTAADTVTYEFRYKDVVDPNGSNKELEPLFTSFTIPGTLDSDDMQSIKDLTITVTGHAIQAAGFTNENLAWAAFDDQHNP